MHAAFPTHFILLNFMDAAKSAALQTNGMAHDLSVCLCFWQSLAAIWRISQQIFTAKSQPDKIYANIFYLGFLYDFNFPGTTAHLRRKLPHCWNSLITHTHTHTLGSTPLNEWSARRICPYLHNTQQTQQTNIHAIGGTRIRIPSNLEASDLRLRPHGHRNGPVWLLVL